MVEQHHQESRQEHSLSAEAHAAREAAEEAIYIRTVLQELGGGQIYLRALIRRSGGQPIVTLTDSDNLTEAVLSDSGTC